MSDRIGNGGIAGISRGRNYSVVNKFGENTDIDTASTPEAIWSHGGPFPFLDTGIPMDIVSSSASDSIAGTGAQKVEITYFNTDNTKNVTVYDMAGVARVPINDDVKIVTRMRVIQSGTLKTNAGEINVVDRATGLVVYQSTEIGEGQTLSAVQICPKGQKGLVKWHQTTYARTTNQNNAQLRLRLRGVDGTITTKWNASISTTNPKDTREYDIGGISVQEGEIVFWECITVSANDTPVLGAFDIEFEDV